MTHANAPLSVEGRRRLVARCVDRPIAHVAAEMGISRACASKWGNGSDSSASWAYTIAHRLRRGSPRPPRPGSSG
jgi:hypothetical protein